MRNIRPLGFCLVALIASLSWRYIVAPGDSWDALGSGVVLLPVMLALLVLGIVLLGWHARSLAIRGGFRAADWKGRLLDLGLFGTGAAVVAWALWIARA